MKFSLRKMNQTTKGDTSLVSIVSTDKYHSSVTKNYSLQCPKYSTNVSMFFNCIRHDVEALIKMSRQRDIVKVSLGVATVFEKLPDGEHIPIYYNPTFYPLLADNLFSDFYDSTIDNFSAWMDDFQDRGSGMSFVRISHAFLKIVKIKPIVGKSYIPLSFNKFSITNIQNTDNKCFLWCLIAKFYPEKRNKTRVSHYKKYECLFRDIMGDIQYPVKLSDIPKINSLAINVYGLENINDPSTIYPIQISTYKDKEEINLLYLESNTNTHYCLITDLDSLLSAERNKHKYHTCRNCLQGFTTKEVRDRHREVCMNHESCRAILPNPGSSIFFKNHQYCHKLPFVVYADFESINCRVDDPNIISQQKVVSFGVYVSSLHEHILASKYYTYTGYDCIEKFIYLMMSIFNTVKHAEHKRIKNVSKEFQSETHCYMCNQLLDRKIAEHCHLSGNYRGASCHSCNMKEGKSGKILPILFHNGSNYDFHFFINELMKYTNQKEKVNVLARSKEEYISISYGSFYNKMIFLDSYRFLQKSLADVAKILDTDTEKGIYPYEYVDSIERLINTTSLPSKEHFYSSLKQEGVTDEEYQEAQNAWDKHGCRNLLDYHNHYLKSDVMILRDSFEKFRDFFLKHHNIDPCYCYSTPGLTWQCGLKYTNINLECLTDYNLLLLFEKGVRGGYSGVLGRRHVKADDNRQLLFLDANSLYAYAMSQPLPTGDFRWENPHYFWNYCNANGDYPFEEGRGYVFEVDLQHTQESFNKTVKYPLAPENKVISINQMSEYQKNIMDEEDVKESVSKRLILDMKNKSNYVIHYKLLRFYVSLGMRITHIHNVVSFKESPWLKSYIDFNIQQRTAATNAFEKDLWKLLNNAFYGKTIENVRNRKNISLVQNDEEIKHQASKGTFVDYDTISQNLTLISHKKASIRFDKPIYLGMCILDYSKLVMYDFYYNVVQKIWPNNELLYHDTDSFVLSIPVTKEKLQEDMMLIRDEHLDTSDYPTDSPLHSLKNKKKPGYMKDELQGKRMTEFIALRSKVYTFRTEDETEVKKVKGVSKATTDKHLTFNDYLQTLYTGDTIMRHNYSLGSHNHEMFLKKVNRKALSAFDCKRFICDDGITTEPYI